MYNSADSNIAGGVPVWTYLGLTEKVFREYVAQPERMKKLSENVDPGNTIKTNLRNPWTTFPTDKFWMWVGDSKAKPEADAGSGRVFSFVQLFFVNKSNSRLFRITLGQPGAKKLTADLMVLIA